MSNKKQKQKDLSTTQSNSTIDDFLFGKIDHQSDLKPGDIVSFKKATSTIPGYTFTNEFAYVKSEIYYLNDLPHIVLVRQIDKVEFDCIVTSAIVKL